MNQTYEGTGTSKKIAKLVAAEAALHALFGDVLPPPDVVAASSEASIKQTAEVADTLETGVPGMNPTIVLNRLRPGTTYEDIESIPTDPDVSDILAARFYHVSCVVDGTTFTGSAVSKKMAKARAAAEALEKVFELSCIQTASGYNCLTMSQLYILYNGLI